MSKATSTVVGVVLVGALAFGAWWVWIRPTPVADGVMFVGDSVTYLASGDLSDDLSAKHPALLARVGYRSTDLLPLFQKQVDERKAAGDPLDQVVVLVGYNDVLRDDVDAPALGKMMDLAQQFDCAVWFTLPPVPLRDELTDVWNTRVRDAAASHDHVHVVDTWREAVKGSRPGVLVSSKDGVHPTKPGARRLTDLFEQAVGKEC